ncbi:DegT/DnrJ/EryC1/StrS family aminotransferase [Candidatus Pacearchaeota archaeon]|nr:DegT/DnrJ/EryC1/StrS family aminotransferase [Candidatus Pacearchaeota archaeon]
MRIEFGDLKLGESARRHIDDVLRTSWVSAGPKVAAFEEGWGKLFGYKHNVAMDNGTSADMACCMTLYDLVGAERGDEIIAPALAFAAVGNSIVAAGFRPSFVDVRKETLNIDATKIEEKITHRTRAIIAVHTMGKPCAMDPIMELAKKYGLKVIEDSCEAHGAKYNGKYVGHFGDMAAFSFYAAHLICCGEGGMVSTNDSQVAELLNSVRSHGRKPDSLYFDHLRFGLNFKMNDLEAAIGLSQIEQFREIFDTRKKNLLYLMDRTLDLQDIAYFNTESPNEEVTAHAFSVTLKDPKLDAQRLAEFLESNDIKCKRNFGSMPTQHRAFEFLGHRLGEFPEAEYIGNNGIHFGCHQYLTKDDLDFVSDKLHEYFATAR